MAKTMRSPRGLGVKQASLKGGGVMLSGGVGGTAAAKKYTDESIAGVSGTLAGKNCTIQSKTAIAGGTRIVFAWTADNGASRTESLDVMDGRNGNDGADAPEITGITLNDDNTLTVTLSDGSRYDTAAVRTAKGEKGDKGDAGEKGEQGAKGDTPTVEVGTTDTVAFDEPAEVTAEPTDTGVKLNFRIPKGKNGDGGGAGGTSDYDDLDNKPKVNGVTLSGDRSASDLGLYTKQEIDAMLAGTLQLVSNE